MEPQNRDSEKRKRDDMPKLPEVGNDKNDAVEAPDFVAVHEFLVGPKLPTRNVRYFRRYGRESRRDADIAERPSSDS